jgi:sulfoxide reductase heme-binding subunit YedZ
LHFFWLVKKDIREPLAYAVVLAALLGIRLYYKYQKRLIHKANVKLSEVTQ